MTKTFVGERFRSTFIASTLSLMIAYLVLMSGNIIAGNILGESALAGLTLILPFFTVLIFISYLISIGTGVAMAIKTGEEKTEEANLYFSQGLILITFISVSLFTIMSVFQTPILSLLGAEGEALSYAVQYYSKFVFLTLVFPFFSYFYTVVLNQGNEQICLFASIMQVTSCIGLSVLLCLKLGIGGIALGNVISTAIALVVLFAHFFTVRNTLKFRWYLNFQAVLHVLKFSLNDAVNYLYSAIVIFVLNAYLLKQYGINAIIVYTVVVSVQSLLIAAGDGIGETIQPLACIYHGEKNTHGLKKMMKIANKACFFESLIISVLLCIFSGLIAPIFGIQTPAIQAEVQKAVCIYAFSTIFYNMCLLYISYYIYINRVLLALVLTTVTLLLAPIFCTLFLGQFFGLNGVWIGLFVSSILAFAISVIIVAKIKHKLTFPLLLDKNLLDSQFSYDVEGTKEGLGELMMKIEDDLKKRQIPHEKILKIQLMIEETEMIEIRKNKQKQPIIIECSLFLDIDKITLILRETGGIHDATDEDQDLGSMEDYIATRIISDHRDKNYILSSGYNRTVYYF